MDLVNKKIIIGIVVGAILVFGAAAVFDWKVFEKQESVQVYEEKEQKTEETLKIAEPCPKGYTSELNESSVVVWRGKIENTMTYGRYEIKKYPEDNQLPLFVAEFYDSEEPNASHKFKVGDFVETKGQFEGVERNDFGCRPWILADTIQLSIQ